MAKANQTVPPRIAATTRTSTPIPKLTPTPTPPLSGPPSVLVINATGYSDAAGNSADPTQLPTMFHVTGALAGFNVGNTIYGLLFDANGNQVPDAGAKPSTPAAPVWSLFFDLSALAAPPTGSVPYHLKVAYDDSTTHDDASDRADVTVVFP